MSVNFSANQYEQAFDPKRIQNWEVAKEKGKYPKPREGFSTIHANDRGHLLPKVPRERSSPWGTHVGTWDMPTKIPERSPQQGKNLNIMLDGWDVGNRQLNPTARSEDAQLSLHMKKMDAAEVMSGGLKKCKIPSPQPVKIDEEALPCNNPPVVGMHGPSDPTALATKGTLTPPVLPMTHDVRWPRHAAGDMDLPVGNAASPKPPTPMPLGGENVQAEARRIVSPVDPEQVAAKGAISSPVEPVTGQMRTPEANVNWPMARSAEPPEVC